MVEMWQDDLRLINNLEIAELENEGRPRTFHHRDNAFELEERKFIKLFRLSKPLANNLIEQLELVMPPPSRHSALDVESAVLATVRVFACGGYQLGIGQDINLAICQPTVSRAISAVTTAMNVHLFPEWVSYPLRNLEPIKRGFFEEYGFPGVAGAIDCTHIAIVPPPQLDPLHPEHIYVNRKNYHSINVQLVCDAKLRILHANANYPGSTNDAFIWRNSNLKQSLQLAHDDNVSTWLIGDSGYPLEPWLMTPITNPANQGAVAYNRHQMQARSTVERGNGLLKMRWRCLLKDRALHYMPLKATQIITACTVLHNMCVAHNVPDPPPEEGDEQIDFGMDVNVDDDLGVAARGQNPILANGRRLQQRLIRRHFHQQV